MLFYPLLFFLASLVLIVDGVSRKPDERPSSQFNSRLSGPPNSPTHSSSPSSDHATVKSPRDKSPKYSDFSATDSRDSFTGKETAPGRFFFTVFYFITVLHIFSIGTEAYHKEMHRLYNRKTSFHNEMYKGTIRREPNFALDHKEEEQSSERRHRIHGRIKRKIASGRLKPGIRTKTPEPFPKLPNSRRVDNLRRNRNITWREKKGFKRLLPEPLPQGQRRKRRKQENVGRYSPDFDQPSTPDSRKSSSDDSSSSSSSGGSSPPRKFPSPYDSDGSPKGGVAVLT